MKPNPKSRNKSTEKGFALIVTLSLMILLTVIAVGLLMLSTITLRSTGQGAAMATARSNARLALMLALGELQKTAGPDTRITAPANLVIDNAAPGVTGVWKSWRPAPGNTDYEGAKVGDNFMGYLMSNPNPGGLLDPASLPAVAGGKNQQLVGTGSVGTTDTKRQISAPLVNVAGTKGANGQGAISWAVLDEGVKSRIDLLPGEESTGQGDLITQVGSGARNGFEGVEKMAFLTGERAALLESLPKLVSMDQVKLASQDKESSPLHFHDFTVDSSSVQADVANGGLKTDLSVLFDGNFGAVVPAPYNNKYVYSDGTAPYEGTATNSDPQWSLYANYARLYRKTSGTDNPKTGMKASLPSGYSLKTIYDKKIQKNRYEPNMASLKQPMLMPTVVRVDMVFTVVAREAHGPHRDKPAYPYMLHFMYLPVITLHNPYNTPLRVTNMVVEFSDIPIGFEFHVNNQPTTSTGLLSMNDLYQNGGGGKKTFSMTLSNSLSAATEVVMGAGETRIFGTPFPAEATWEQEVAANGKSFFDWDTSNKPLTSTAKTMPGVICGPTDGVGFDVDWLAPQNGRSAWVTSRKDGGVVLLKADDSIRVRFGPKAPTSASNIFSVALKLGGVQSGTTQVFYLSNSRLEEIMEEGVSPRFSQVRNFPETFPRGGSTPINTMSIFESNTTKVKDYTRARPFAVFSVGAKTTVESFTRSRPVADTGISFQMATCDFTTSATQGASPLEFSLVPVTSGGMVIESGGITDSKGTPLQAFFFGGHGSNTGTNNATIFEVPMAPLQSIAQLRHANTGSIGSMPYVAYTVGESRAHPAISSSKVVEKPDSSRHVLDHSWLSNDQLWDRYWFSSLSTLQGVAYQGTSAKTQEALASEFFSGTTHLPNTRNVAYLSAGKTVEDASTEARTTGGRKSASCIMTRGGFNVNSTSVAAWKSVLTTLLDSDVPLAGGNNDTNPAGTPVLRMRQPVGGSGLTPRERLWNSYRSLDKDQIDSLAKEIVKEVKERGPFLSMSEFVNRRLTEPGELSRSGAIQAAIDRTSINETMSVNALAVSANEISGYGWQNPDAVARSTGAGAPGEVSQGDILSAIGSFVSVRSDTFRIRAFGDARTPAGVVTARAWCEATVQRIPDYLDATDAPDATASIPTNVNFGRQFRIVSFRWLHPEEV
ncbi:MAG: hypothetical protein EOP88_11820 [Verrucomicrobiaceae bacterium]|nr:MAG: hypothetical protein EOP88_11820 [Verrucomicrobiaceae bacterium]